jgi:hypothetical protein
VPRSDGIFGGEGLCVGHIIAGYDVIGRSSSLFDITGATDDPGYSTGHRKKPHCHPTLRMVLEVVGANRSQNRNCSYFANERYRHAAPVKNLGEISDRLVFNPPDDCNY